MPPKPPASEREFLDLLDSHFPNEHRHMPLARGDDCARLRCDGDLVLSTDLFLEDIHFRRSYFSPEAIGHKALAVNLSDIAAMGCRPLGFSLGLMLPENGLSEKTALWDRLLGGMSRLARQHDLPLTGGDLSKAPALGFGITIWGEPAAPGRVLTRRANPGDALLVVGTIGLARLGLTILEHFSRETADSRPRAVAAHLTPQPRVREGMILAAAEGVTGCMDVSDGLAQDLPRLLGPKLGAVLTIPDEILGPEIVGWCAKTGQEPARFAYQGGEDYALLAAASPAAEKALRRALPDMLRIGTVIAEPEIILNGKTAPKAGFDHFS